MKKWVWTAIIILGGGALLLVALLPTILSSDRGTQFVIRMVENRTGGNLSVGDLSFSWTGNQTVDKLQFSEGEGFELSCQKIDSTCSFWNLLFRSGSIGTTRIDSPTIVAYPKVSQQRIDQLKKAREKLDKPEGKFWTNLGGHLIVSNGNVTVRQQGVSLDDVAIDLNLGKTPTFLFEGKTRAAGREGSIYGKGEGKDPFEGVVSLRNVPSLALDQVLALVASKYQGLLTVLLGDTVNAELTANSGQFSLNLTSPRLRTDLKALFESDTFTLNTPGRIALTLLPDLFNHFTHKISLQSNAQAELLLSSATLPFKKGAFKIEELAGQGTLNLSSGRFLLKEMNQTLDLNTLKANFNTQALERLLNLSLTSAMQLQGIPSSINGTLAIAQLFKTPTFPNLDLSVQSLPLALVDASLPKYLGNTFTGKVTKSESHLAVNGKTPLLTLQELALNIGNKAVLTAPMAFLYQVTPKIYEKLAAPFQVEGILSTLSVPTSKEGLLFKESDFELTLKSSPVNVTDLFALGRAHLPSFEGMLKGTSLETIIFDLDTIIAYQDQSWGQAIFGNNVGLTATGKAFLGDPFALSPLNLSFQGRKFQGTIAAAIEKGTLILKKGLKVNTLLEPNQINPILSQDTEYPLMTQATPVTLEIKPSKIPLDPGALTSLAIKGVGKIDDLHLINPANKYPFTFDNVQVDFHLDGKKNAHTINFEGRAIEGRQNAGKLNMTLVGSGKASNLIAAPDTVKVKMEKFSSQIADVFLKTRGQLPDLVGPNLDLNYASEKVGGRQNLDLMIDSRDLSLEGAFYAGQRLELRSPRRPLKIRWNISEQSYDAFRRWRNPNVQLAANNPLFQIDGSGTLNIQISPFSVPLQDQGEGFPKPNFNLFGSRFDAAVQIDDLKLKHGRTGALAELEKFNFDIAKKDTGNAPMTFKFDGDVIPFAQGGSGTIRGEGTMKDFLSREGSLDFKDVTTTIQAQVRNLPSIFVDALSKFDQASGFPPSAFLGDLFNATFDANIEKSQGKINMDVNASACRASFSGIVSDGILYLHEPLKAAFTVPPQLNDVLEKGAKLYIDAIEKPITLFIHDEGFSVPLKDLHIKNMNFKYGQLDLGQILCKNTGSTSEVGGLFKSEERGNVSLWFAPAEFNMRRGKLNLDRTEILYNRAYQVCLWGQLLFPKRYVDMTLGLTAQALRSALGIQGIDDDYVLKVPVEGPFGNVEINTGSATGKIAFLVARKQIAPQAGIWGQVFGAISDLADDQSDVPPPKPPFPWQHN